MEMKISLSKHAHVNGDVQAVTERLIALRKAMGDQLSAEAIWEDAKNEASPLHAEFVWDGGQAVADLGLQRAQYLLRNLEVVMIHPKLNTPYSGPLTINVAPAHHKPMLIDVPTAMDDDVLRAKLVGHLMGKLVNLKTELSKYKEFVGVVKAIDELEAPGSQEAA